MAQKGLSVLSININTKVKEDLNKICHKFGFKKWEFVEKAIKREIEIVKETKKVGWAKGAWGK